MDSDELAKKIAKERLAIRKKLDDDPFIGFTTFDESLEECKFTSQPEVLARLYNRENIFISGLAGTGKTTVINRFVELIDAEYDGLFNIAITASTGIAATLIGGSTLHSWAGLGISTEPFDKKEIPGQMYARRENLETADVLIIDEISMLPAYLFTKLDKALKHFRRSSEPFGGVQIVLIGDFLQLPPVSKNDEADVDTRFAIETDEWKEGKFSHCFLDKSYRSNDERLKKVLVEITNGGVSSESRAIIDSRTNAPLKPGCVSTTLFTTNKNVDAFNWQELEKNPSSPRLFRKRVDFAISDKDVEKAMKTMGIPEELTFKMGATVIATSNVVYADSGESFVNGSLGEIVGFSGENIIVRFNSGKIINVRPHQYKMTEKVTIDSGKENFSFDNLLASIFQIPLKLGYAITVHKSQGQTFDGVSVDLSKCFQPGLGYVALSRVRSIDDLSITGFSEKAYSVSDKSQAITIFVKKRAILARRKLVEDKDHYETLLTDDMFRLTMWDVSDCATVKYEKRMAKRNKF